MVNTDAYQLSVNYGDDVIGSLALDKSTNLLKSSSLLSHLKEHPHIKTSDTEYVQALSDNIAARTHYLREQAADIPSITV
ncbi:hypothetical protein C9928_00725 [Pseudidiomarina aestuarii]|uniref:Uncharacterized protein n=1 Tax=Pseudidiomarina aestuarii TaxID=624146 RepID=A0A2T4D8W9_9GAMM|nr:hypothetical protein C9939_01925 [Pseudidiomarina aestuarii]PTB90276.1 hypothetical protein C9928_00725 [Pseudidiomarina aestuarii]